jgi:pilus assembly protein CpaF
MDKGQEIAISFYNSIASQQSEYGRTSQSNIQIEKQLEAFAKGINDADYKMLREEILGYGPLSDLIEDQSIGEIIINNFQNIWIEKNGHLSLCPRSFLSDNSYKNILSRIQNEAGLEANMNQPFIDGTWREHRLHLCIPPVTAHYSLSIRKKSALPWGFERLKEVGWGTQDQIKILRDLYENKKSFLVVGGTSSGKTSVLNSFMQITSPSERILIIEDTSEVLLPNPCSNRLLSRQDPQKLFPDVTLQDLVRQSLRMRPDRIVMGEVRGVEAKDLLMAFATGHEGSCGTIHATSATEALLRLEMLIQLGAPQWSLDAVRRLLFLSLHYLIVVNKNKLGQRKLEGVYRLSSLESFGITVERIA